MTFPPCFAYDHDLSQALGVFPMSSVIALAVGCASLKCKVVRCNLISMLA